MPDLIEQLSQLLGKPQLIEAPNTHADAVALPPGWKAESLEKFALTPARIEQRITTQRVVDFANYVNRYKEPHSLIVMAPSLSIGQPLAEAHIEYHERDTEIGVSMPHWNKHRAVYAPLASPAYQMLLDIDNKLFPQAEFATRIRDVARFVVQPAAADLLEVIRTLALTSKGEFASFDDDLTGSVQMRFDLQVSASAGTQQRKLDVPRELTFHVPLLLDSEPQTVRAELVYRIPRTKGDGVTLGIRLPERVWMEQALIEAQATAIGEATGLLIIVGEVK